MGKNQGWKGKEPVQEKRWTHAGWAKAAFSVDEGSVGGKKANIGRYQIALESLLMMAYLEGRPIERQVQARGDYVVLQQMLAERIARSKAAQDSLHNTVLTKEIIKALPDGT